MLPSNAYLAELPSSNFKAWWGTVLFAGFCLVMFACMLLSIHVEETLAFTVGSLILGYLGVQHLDFRVKRKTSDASVIDANTRARQAEAAARAAENFCPPDAPELAGDTIARRTAPWSLPAPDASPGQRTEPGHTIVPGLTRDD